MSNQALARKWRPRQFADVVGQEHILKALVHALDQNRLHHAYLFTGTRGVGKTTIARIFAKALNCEEGVSAEPCGKCSACRSVDEGRFVDLLEVDAASRTKVDDTRELLDNVQYAPAVGRYKVYLIDEVHMLSGHSFNALLKTLEEPPAHVVFLFATTDPKKLPVTVLSRCLQFNLRALNEQEIAGQMRKVLEAESLEYDDKALALVSDSARGSMRDALSLLDQAVAYGSGRVVEDDVRQMLGMVDDAYIQHVLDALVANDSAALMDAVAKMAEMSVDFEAALDDLIFLLYQLAMMLELGRYPVESRFDKDWLKTLSEQTTPEDVQLYYQIAINGKKDLPYSPYLRTGFEMIVLRMLVFRPAGSGGSNDAPRTRSARAGSAGTSAQRASRSADVKADDRAQVATTVAGQPAAFPSSPASSHASNDDWHDVVNHLPLNGLLREIALNAVLQGREPGRVSLQVESVHERILNADRRQKLEAALTEYYGEAVKLDVAFGSPSEETPRARADRIKSEQRQALVDEVRANPVVKDIQQRFGAELDENSIQRNEQQGDL